MILLGPASGHMKDFQQRDLARCPARLCEIQCLIPELAWAVFCLERPALSTLSTDTRSGNTSLVETTTAGQWVSNVLNQHENSPCSALHLYSKDWLVRSKNLSSDRDLAGIWRDSELHAGVGVRIDADTQKAGQVNALGAVGAAAQNAGEGTVLVAAALVLKDAHGLGGSALWHVRWAGAGVALGGTHAATSTLHLSLGLVLLARRLLVVAAAGSRRRWGRRRRGRRGRRWRGALAGHDGVGCLALDAALTRSRLATLQLHVTGLAPARSPAVPDNLTTININTLTCVL